MLTPIYYFIELIDWRTLIYNSIILTGQIRFFLIMRRVSTLEKKTWVVSSRHGRAKHSFPPSSLSCSFHYRVTHWV
uniref:Uncharacterized protein n=1 Tax=Utricularia reniformis TaxID=192314 RepID=A0A1Y0AZ66_9LAMI|nr:hypothetical protein AEK19_MT2132 [Utricularia reniformis]ART30434.1 hypothetical protein AEK19_MT2132 [Utricularia reniformis]